MSDNEPTRKKRQPAQKSPRRTKNAGQKTKDPISTAPSDSNPGILLKNARVKQGRTIEDVAAYFKLNTHTIEHMENNQYEDNKLTVYTRGYLRHYTNYLDLNYDAMITALASLGIDVNYEALPAANTKNEHNHAPKVAFNQQDVKRVSKWLIMMSTLILIILFIVKNIDNNTSISLPSTQPHELSHITQLISLKKSQQKHILNHSTTHTVQPVPISTQNTEPQQISETLKQANEQNTTN